VPPLPAAPKVIRVALSGTVSGGAVWLTRHFIQYTGTAPTNAQLHTFDASVITAYTAQIVGLADADTVLTQVESIDLSSSTSAVDITAASVAGTRAGAVLAASTCTVVSYEIGRRYRGGHPRGYWKLGTQSDLTNPRTWSAAFTNACNTDIAAYFTALEAAGWTGAGTLTQVNVSYFSGFHVVTNPITLRARNVPLVRVAPTIDTVTSVLTRSSIGNQRRREAFIA